MPCRALRRRQSHPTTGNILTTKTMTPNTALFILLDGMKPPMLHAGTSFRGKITTVGPGAPVNTRQGFATVRRGQSLPRGNIKVIDDGGIVLDERTIMTGHEHRPRPIRYLLSQIRYGIVIKMIGGLIQDQNRRPGRDNPYEFESARLPRR